MSILEKILELVCIEMDVSVEDVKSPLRKGEITFARQTYCAIAKWKLNKMYNLSVIGDVVNRDHSTVLHSIKEINRALAVSDERAFRYRLIRQKVSPVIDDILGIDSTIDQILIDSDRLYECLREKGICDEDIDLIVGSIMIS